MLSCTITVCLDILWATVTTQLVTRAFKIIRCILTNTGTGTEVTETVQGNEGTDWTACWWGGHPEEWVGSQAAARFSRGHQATLRDDYLIIIPLKWEEHLSLSWWHRRCSYSINELDRNPEYNAQARWTDKVLRFPASSNNCDFVQVALDFHMLWQNWAFYALCLLVTWPGNTVCHTVCSQCTSYLVVLSRHTLPTMSTQALP